LRDGFLGFPGGPQYFKVEETEAAIGPAPFRFEASRSEREALLHRVRESLAREKSQIDQEIIDAKAELAQRQLERDIELAQRRAELEAERADELAEKRAAGVWDLEDTSWQLREILTLPDDQFDEVALTRRFAFQLAQYAEDLMVYEDAAVTGLPRDKKLAHCLGAIEEIMASILPASRAAESLPPEAYDFKLVKSPAGPYWLTRDQYRRIIDIQIAQQGAFEEVAPENLWGLARLSKPRLLLEQILRERLEAVSARIIDDRRGRRELLEDCQLRHGVSKEQIRLAAGIRHEEFYRWLRGDEETPKRRVNNRSRIHRHMVRVLTSPVWPPAKIEW
jgi:hypothetical protein